MNVRTFIAAAAVVALAPLSAQADAPSGEFFEVFAPTPATEQPEPQFPRSEHRNYVEVSVRELIRDSSGADRPTVEEVRRELANSPQPKVGA